MRVTSSAGAVVPVFLVVFLNVAAACAQVGVDARAAEAAAPRVEQPRKFEAMDVFDLEYANTPCFAPDGRSVVYERRSMDVRTDRVRSEIWRFDVGLDGAAAHRPLVGGDGVDARSPRFAPAGTPRLAYLSALGGAGTQIRVRWLDGSQADAAVTSVSRGPANLTWSPDGRSLAFTMFVPAAERAREDGDEPEAGLVVDLPTPPDGANWADPPRVVDSVYWRADGAGELEDGSRHVFVVPAEGGTARRITRGAFDHRGPLSWTPDGQRIVCSANRREDHELEPLDDEVWSVGVEDATMRQLTDRRGPDNNAVLSPDGARLCWIGFDDRRVGYQVRKLYVRDVAGELGPVRVLADDLDRSVSALRWVGEKVLFLYDDEGRTRIGGVDVVTGERSTYDSIAAGGTSLGRPYSGASYDACAFGPDGVRVVYTASRGGPADLHMTLIDSQTEVFIGFATDLNADVFGPGGKTLADIEELRVEGPGGESVQAWYMRPPGAESGPLPTILEIHGGPFANYGPRFAAELQLYAAAGYLVVWANPRGSTSYGERFGNLIHHDYPSAGDYGDLMAVVDGLVARGVADPERLFVTGGSGGGVLSAWIVGRTDRFRAAVVAKPVIHWTSFVLTADSYPVFAKYWFPGPPWEHHEHYWRRSPLSQVGDVTTPTMLLTGEEDFRTPISESEQFYQALKLQGVDTVLVRIPGASHGIASRPSRLIAKVAHVLAWFDRYLPKGDATTDGG